VVWPALAPGLPVELGQLIQWHFANAGLACLGFWALTKLGSKSNEVARNFDEFMPNNPQSHILKHISNEKLGGLARLNIVRLTEAHLPADSQDKALPRITMCHLYTQ
jgi:hypothetical protein